MQDLTTAVKTKIGLGFGLLNISVSIHAAVGPDESAKLRTVCHSGHKPTPIKQTQACPVCANADRRTFGRAAEEDDETFTVIDPLVLAQAKETAGEFKDNIQLTVHPAADVSAVLLPSGKAYYIGMKNPSDSALETYAALALLVRNRTDLAFMTKYTLSTATSLFQLTVAGENTLMLRQMADAELIRVHPDLKLPVLDERVIELSSQLADQKCEPFVVAQHGTTTNTAIADYLAAQAQLAPVAGVPAQGGASVTSLTDALAAAVMAGQKPVRKPRASRAKQAS